MRMVVYFDRPSKLPELCIPMHYNYLMQSMLYNMMDDTLSELYHNNGFILNGRRYKLFTFSRLQFNNGYKIKRLNGQSYLCTKGTVALKISAVDYRILESLACRFMKAQHVHIGRFKLHPISVKVEKTPAFQTPAIIKMLSPLTVHSTINGYRVFPEPWSRQFAELVFFNLVSKYHAARKIAEGKYTVPEEWTELHSGKPVIEPVKVSQKHKKIIPVIKKKNHTGSVVAWLGVYKLNIPAPLIHLAYDAGIGVRNSMGFGMIELVY